MKVFPRGPPLQPSTVKRMEAATSRILVLFMWGGPEEGGDYLSGPAPRRNPGKRLLGEGSTLTPLKTRQRSLLYHQKCRVSCSTTPGSIRISFDMVTRRTRSDPPREARVSAHAPGGLLLREVQLLAAHVEAGSRSLALGRAMLFVLCSRAKSA